MLRCTDCFLLMISALLVFCLAFTTCLLGGRGASIASRLREHKDGTIYDGEWVRGNKEGFGVYKYTNGSRYEVRLMCLSEADSMRKE